MNLRSISVLCLFALSGCQSKSIESPPVSQSEQASAKPAPIKPELLDAKPPTTITQAERDTAELEIKRSRLAARIPDYEKALKDSEEALQQIVMPGGRMRQGPRTEKSKEEARATATVCRDKFILFSNQNQLKGLDYQLLPKHKIMDERRSRIKYLRSYGKTIEKELKYTNTWRDYAKVSEPEDVAKSLEETIANWERENSLVQQQLTEMEDKVLGLIAEPDKPLEK